MTPFVFISALVASYVCYVQGRDEDEITFPSDSINARGRVEGSRDSESSCPTPSGGPGNCVSLYDCAPLMAIVNNPNKSQQDINVLRRSQCGYQGDIPKVCCPAAVQDETCFTADGQQGTCVGIYSCPHIANMLKPPVAQETIAYVQNSKCDGPEQYSVCCGPPPNNNPRPSGVCTNTAAPPDPRTRCCGLDSSADDRIVGGEVASVDQYPWMVIIEYVKNNKIKLLCGGVLISGRYVLTAGHCVVGPVLDSGTPRNVRLGEYDITTDGPDCVDTAGGGQDCTEGVTLIPIEKITPHPDYNPRSNLRRHDIALLRLRSMAPYTDFIRPICLPQTDVTANPPTNPLTFFVAGWGAVNDTLGKSNIKLYVDVPYKNKQECQPAYSVPRRNVALWNGQLCAGGVLGKDSCKGDSGGPLMYEHDKIYEVVGIVSFGPTPCGLENIPGVYTKVYEYNSWIRSNIKP